MNSLDKIYDRYNELKIILRCPELVSIIFD